MANFIFYQHRIRLTCFPSIRQLIYSDGRYQPAIQPSRQAFDFAGQLQFEQFDIQCRGIQPASLAQGIGIHRIKSYPGDNIFRQCRAFRFTTICLRIGNRVIVFQFLQNVLRCLNQFGSLPDQRMTPSRQGRMDGTGNGKNITPLIDRCPCSDQ